MKNWKKLEKLGFSFSSVLKRFVQFFLFFLSPIDAALRDTSILYLVYSIFCFVTWPPLVEKTNKKLEKTGSSFFYSFLKFFQVFQVVSSFSSFSQGHQFFPVFVRRHRFQNKNLSPVDVILRVEYNNTFIFVIRCSQNVKTIENWKNWVPADQFQLIGPVNCISS